jgi:ribosomal protein L23
MNEFQQLIKKAYDVKVDKVGTKKVSLNIRWLDIQGEFRSNTVELREGDKIEF